MTHQFKRPILRLEKSAKGAGLCYVSDLSPGYSRKARGKRFQYFDTRGRLIKNRSVIKRIDMLAIPPAYKNVWISPNPKSHIQAVGYDARGRKQYRYHPKWREARDTHKYDRVMSFSRAIPIIREATRKHLKLPGLNRKKILAAVVQLLEKTLIRVGNEEYAVENGSIGLTTMRARHVNVRGSKMIFRFIGKSGIKHSIEHEDKQIAEIIRECRASRGQELFKYINDEGKCCTIRSDDVNAYLKELTNRNFTAKDFRTWAGTVLAAKALRDLPMFETETQAKRHINQALDSVAKKLGNTKTICRKSYVHPAILASYLDGDTIETVLVTSRFAPSPSSTGLDIDERATITLVARRVKRALTPQKKTISAEKPKKPIQLDEPIAA
ncbi:MAG: DNA topoisomerase IB [Bdellovibrionia bacterium]